MLHPLMRHGQTKIASKMFRAVKDTAQTEEWRTITKTRNEKHCNRHRSPLNLSEMIEITTGQGTPGETKTHCSGTGGRMEKRPNEMPKMRWKYVVEKSIEN